MTKRQSAKYKIDRRLGVNLWGRPKSPFNKRNYRPGQHGPNQGGKPSDYRIQLLAKQRLRDYYGNIGEKRFRRYYNEATRKRGDSSENLLGLLEQRLDMVIYRAKFVPTVFASRQFVGHGHVKVNGKKVDIPSYQVRPGDVLEIAQKSRSIPMVVQMQNFNERDVPEYIESADKNCKATLIRVPKADEIPYPVTMEPNLVIEYYSR